MKITIKRIHSQGEAIEGTLHIDGRYICHTAEHRHTALPAGTYTLVRHYCKQYDRYMPLVLRDGLPDCRTCPSPEDEVSLNTLLPCHCPMLKPGNGVHHRTDGSILLGTDICPGCLRNPLQAFLPLAERIRKAMKRNTEVTLEIKG